MPDRANAVIALRSEGVSVLLDITQGKLPAVVHWGADLGDLSAQDAESLVLSGIHPIAPNPAGLSRPARSSPAPRSAQPA